MSILSAPFSRAIRPSRRRSLENPTIPITAAQLADIFSGGPTYSGISVNEFTAPTYTAVLSCLRVISETIGSLDLRVFRRTGDRTQELVTDHPVSRLLTRQCNESMTPSVFKENVQGHAALWGNGMARIVDSSSGSIVELLPLLPDRTHPERVAGKLTYRLQAAGGGEKSENFAPEEVIHIPAIGFNGVKGWPPIMFAKEPVALGLAAQMFGATFFGNGTSPMGVLETDSVLTDTAFKNLRETWTARHQGPGSANKPAILEQGLKWKPITTDPEKAQFLQTRKFQIAEICRVFRVPPHMVFELDKATNNNIEHQGMEFVNYTLAHWLVKWEQELTRKLFRDPSEADMFVEFSLWKLLRGDMKARQDYFQSAIQSGYLSRNEVRALEGMNPVKGGDAFYVPQNVALVGPDGQLEPVNNPGKPPAGKPEAEPDRDLPRRAAKAHSRLIADVANRLVRRETNAVEKFDRRYEDAKGFAEWREKFFAEQRTYVVEPLIVHGEALAEMALGGDGLPADLAQRVKLLAETVATSYITASAKRLTDGFAARNLRDHSRKHEIETPGWLAETFSQAVVDTVAIYQKQENERTRPC